MVKIYELIEPKEDYPPMSNLHNSLKYYNLEKSNFNYYWATIVGSNQKVYGFFKEIDMDMKAAIKINKLIPKSGRTLTWD